MTIAQDLLGIWEKAQGSPANAASILGVREREVYRALDSLRRGGIVLQVVRRDGRDRNNAEVKRAYEPRRCINIRDGAVVIFSDAHWWPGQEPTLANKALLAVLSRVQPVAVIANGDMMDAAAISKHDPDGWTEAPSVIAELQEVQARMAEIQDASGDAHLLRTIGNHDIRFDKRLAIQVPDYRHLAGMMLRDHLPAWLESWSVEINGAVMVKHRWHQGIHATYNNALKGGRSIVTGHLHRLQATSWTDYNGRRWGVDCGTLSEPSRAQFDYAEDSAKNWGSGFAVLTFHDGMLAPPEFCEVIGNRAFFRGEVVHEEAKGLRARSRTGKAAARPGHNQRRGVPVLRGGMAGGASDKPATVQVPRVRKADGAAKR